MFEPQDNDPCIDCKLFNSKKECEYYHSTAMIIFGYCCHQKKKSDSKH